MLFGMLLAIPSSAAVIFYDCGVDLKWSLDDNGTLTITGTGSIFNFGNGNAVRWRQVREQIKTVVFDGDVTGIGKHAFVRCTNLTDITIPKGVTAIGKYTFGYCSSLTEITIPDGVTTIEEYAFSNCSSLRCITIPASVTQIGNQAFSNCDALTEVNYLGTTEQWKKINIDSGNICLKKATIHTTDVVEEKLAPGTPIGDVKYTKIVAYIDGKPIRSYNINDNTHIVIEDLVQFGFEFQWIAEGDGRAVITGKRTATPDAYTTTYTPDPNAPTEGVAMQYLATNVTAWLGESQVTGYNIGGMTCIWLDELHRIFGYGLVWDGAEGALRLTTQP